MGFGQNLGCKMEFIPSPLPFNFKPLMLAEKLPISKTFVSRTSITYMLIYAAKAEPSKAQWKLGLFF